MAKQRATRSDEQLKMEVVDENDVGIDPHKNTLTASVLNRRGGVVATATFKSFGRRPSRPRGVGARARAGSTMGHRGSELARAAHRRLPDRAGPRRTRCLPDPHRRASRKRRQGKTDALDSVGRFGDR